MVELVGGGFVINEAYPVQFAQTTPYIILKLDLNKTLSGQCPKVKGRGLRQFGHCPTERAIQQQCKFVPQRIFETDIWSPLIWTTTENVTHLFQIDQTGCSGCLLGAVSRARRTMTRRRGSYGPGWTPRQVAGEIS